MSDIYEVTVLADTSSSSSGGSSDFQHGGGPLYVSMQGNFDGATLTVYAASDRDTPTFGIATDAISANTISVAAGTTDTFYCGELHLPPSVVKVESFNVGASTSVRVVFSNVQ